MESFILLPVALKTEQKINHEIDLKLISVLRQICFLFTETSTDTVSIVSANC